MVDVGENAPKFKLEGVDENSYSLDQFSDKVIVVIFTCNHCPYAKAYEDRIIQLQTAYESDIQILAINSNDDQAYPEDSFENMKVRSKEKNFNFPYLRDESQEIARNYDAKVTPHVFVLKNEIVMYKGRIDDNWENEDKTDKQDLRAAIFDLSSDGEVKVKETEPIGCSIKWK